MWQYIRTGSAGIVLGGLGLGLVFAFLPAAPDTRAAGVDYCSVVTLRSGPPPQCYDAAHRGQCIAWEFNDYWERNGGLPVFGYPISGIACEIDPASGNRYYMQWFERRRLELHPELPPRYTISEGLLGVERVKQLGRSAVLGNPIDPHFTSYWSGHGLDFGDPGYSAAESTALFGLPISTVAIETNGTGWTGPTQWFERARFEWHTEFSPPIVLLGLLGDEVNSTISTSAPFAMARHPLATSASMGQLRLATDPTGEGSDIH